MLIFSMQHLNGMLDLSDEGNFLSVIKAIRIFSYLNCWYADSFYKTLTGCLNLLLMTPDIGLNRARSNLLKLIINLLSFTATKQYKCLYPNILEITRYILEVYQNSEDIKFSHN